MTSQVQNTLIAQELSDENNAQLKTLEIVAALLLKNNPDKIRKMLSKSQDSDNKVLIALMESMNKNDAKGNNIQAPEQNQALKSGNATEPNDDSDYGYSYGKVLMLLVSFMKNCAIQNANLMGLFSKENSDRFQLASLSATLTKDSNLSTTAGELLMGCVGIIGAVTTLIGTGLSISAQRAINAEMSKYTTASSTSEASSSASSGTEVTPAAAASASAAAVVPAAAAGAAATAATAVDEAAAAAAAETSAAAAAAGTAAVAPAAATAATAVTATADTAATAATATADTAAPVVPAAAPATTPATPAAPVVPATTLATTPATPAAPVVPATTLATTPAAASTPALSMFDKAKTAVINGFDKVKSALGIKSKAPASSSTNTQQIGDGKQGLSNSEMERKKQDVENEYSTKKTLGNNLAQSGVALAQPIGNLIKSYADTSAANQKYAADLQSALSTNEGAILQVTQGQEQNSQGLLGKNGDAVSATVQAEQVIARVG
ncbi:MAG: hypothetical protein HZB76_06200 [Chlamydiae bacterium]|nr:hypothetical protein [Chlamydiota bacterium]